ncbi:MAG: carboxylating nicotinate-nucleotide diphosphorylase [Planctomycetota bacterium]
MSTPAPTLPEFYESLRKTGLVRRLLELARDEDLGDGGDVTSLVTIPERQQGRAAIVARQPGVLAGLAVVPDVLAVFAPRCGFESKSSDGRPVATKAVVGVIDGPMREILAAERTLLNIVSRLSGVATRTAEFVTAMGPSKAKLCDTRKTTPGLRVLEKYAVRCGGGESHRLGLHDAVLIKDNHLSGVPVERLAAYVGEAARRARELRPSGLAFIEVEVDSLEQLAALLTIEPGLLDIVLLDNMSPIILHRAVEMRDAAGTRVLLEASGGVNLTTIRAIAATGVDRVSVGSLTHAAVSLDFGLDAIA